MTQWQKPDEAFKRSEMSRRRIRFSGQQPEKQPAGPTPDPSTRKQSAPKQSEQVSTTQKEQEAADKKASGTQAEIQLSRVATIGVDTDGDGVADYTVSGMDCDGDGIPDALQVPGPLADHSLNCVLPHPLFTVL